jgi:iron complex transport system permease protein
MVLAIFLGAVAGFVLARGSDRYALGRAMLAFSLGSLDNAAVADIVLVAPLVVAGVIAAWAWGRPLDVVLSGEAEAASLGVDLPRLRRWVLTWTAVLSAGAVVLGGGVGFVCLVVPNALRPWLGAAHRPLVLGSALGGALFLTLADTCARRLAPAGGEIPLGVVTGLVGAPFFIWFFRRERAAGRL